MRWVLAVLLGVTLLTGCASQKDDGSLVPIVPPSKIDVDTPTLRTMKAAAGVADCVPGTGANDLPDVTLPCFGGGPDVRLDKLAGPLVLSFWGSWCGPCRKELPFYARASEAYAGKVAVIGIDYTDPQTESAMELLGDSGATYPQLADPGGDLRGRSGLPSLNNLPLAMFVAADGSVAGVNIGEISSYAELQRLIQQHLGVGA